MSTKKEQRLYIFEVLDQI